MILLLGGRGRLGRALAAHFGPECVEVLPRDVYASWSAPGSVGAIRHYLRPYADSAAIVVVASGLLDPGSPVDALDAVNFWLPNNVIRASNGLGIKVLTFGTIMERLSEQPNPYVRSKIALAEAIDRAVLEPRPLHIRIHTLYGGGEPSPFMFLGQMLTALRTRTPFAMTSGAQLREYHHVDDDARAIGRFLELAMEGVVDLTHGQPCTLRAIAEAVFADQGQGDLLEIGRLETPASENFGVTLERPEFLGDLAFRDTLGGIVDFIRSLSSPLHSCPPVTAWTKTSH